MKKTYIMSILFLSTFAGHAQAASGVQVDKSASAVATNLDPATNNCRTLDKKQAQVYDIMLDETQPIEQRKSAFNEFVKIEQMMQEKNCGFLD